jgi:hypothetical protein
MEVGDSFGSEGWCTAFVSVDKDAKPSSDRQVSTAELLSAKTIKMLVLPQLPLH